MSSKVSQDSEGNN